jgi:octaprenyl-diphosphate synthase
MDREKLKELLEPVEADLQKFDQITDEVLSSESDLISNVIFHLLKKKGKRIRPAISFLISRAAGLTHPNMVKAALAIELIHTATLLHDDVVDDSGTRRGQSTVNYKWNNLVAVLMGDYFFAKAFRLLVETDSSELVARVSRATEQVSYGELRQIEETFNWDLDENEYYRIIGDKTAALFSVSSASCAILRCEEPGRVSSFSGFGNDIGTAFQIADDILDLVGTTSRTGKEVGLDLLQGKVTLPLIYTLREGSNSEKEEIMAILNNGLNEDSLEKILAYINSEGGVDYARRRATDYGRRALDFVRGFPKSSYSQSLENIIHFTINRDN